MTEISIKSVALALREGDKARARREVKALLEREPTADAWFLAANAMDGKEQAIRCLKKAIELDNWHVKSNRMLLELEGTPEHDIELLRKRQAEELANSPGMKDLSEITRQRKTMAFQVRARRRRRFNRILLICFLVLSVTCSTLTMSLIGVIQGPLRFVIEAFGGPPPVYELDGLPVEDVPFAAATIEPARSVEASSQDVNVLEAGYVHEYRFEARSGEEVYGYVQFMSVSASDVSSNTVIINPQGQITDYSVCEFLGDSGILGGEGNVTFTCRINITGEWRVRILGIGGESVGAYFIGVESLSN